MKLDDQAKQWLKDHADDLKGVGDTKQQETLLGENYQKVRDQVDARVDLDDMPAGTPVRTPLGLRDQDPTFDVQVVISAGLTDNQFDVVMLKMDGMTEAHIAHKLKMSQQAVNKAWKAAQVRIRETAERLKSEMSPQDKP